MTDRSPTREAGNQVGSKASAYVYALDYQASGCEQEGRDLSPHSSARAGSRQSASKPNVTSQAARRAAARDRGDCGVCCRVPAEPGRFRCLACKALRANESKRIREPRETAAERRARCLRDGVCWRCDARSKRFAVCLSCRRVDAERTAKRRDGVPSAGSSGNPRPDEARVYQSPQIEGDGL